jgi:hypothetical protein
MKSVRVQIDEPARKDDPEKTRAQKKKSDWLVNDDLKLIGDPTRIEEPSGATLRSLLIGPSDRRCNLVRPEATRLSRVSALWAVVPCTHATGDLDWDFYWLHARRIYSRALG